jgi:hypothetical protein
MSKKESSKNSPESGGNLGLISTLKMEAIYSSETFGSLTKLHDVTDQKTKLFIVTTVRN